MLPRALLLAALLAPGGFAARAEGAAAEGGEGEEGTVESPIFSVPLAVGAVEYTAEVNEPEAPPADLRLLRADGGSMADQGYLVPELGRQGCAEAGLRFDDALPPLLAADGSWQVAGGCR